MTFKKEQKQQQAAMQKAFPTTISGIKKQWSENDKMAKMSPEQFQKKYYSSYSPGGRSAEETSKNNKTKFDLDFYNKLKSTGETTQPFEEFRKTWGLDPKLIEQYKQKTQADYYKNQLSQRQSNLISQAGQYGGYRSQVPINPEDFYTLETRYNLMKQAGEILPSFEQFSKVQKSLSDAEENFKKRIKG